MRIQAAGVDSSEESLVALFAEIAERLRSAARGVREQRVMPHVVDVEPEEVSEAELNRLRALGYVD